MSDICKFPTCRSTNIEHDGYCLSHAIYSSKAKPEKEKKRIAKRSAKLKKQMAKYKPEMIAWLANNQLCQIKMKGCTGIATQVHHSAGRSGAQLRNQDDWIASCTHCNIVGVEENDAEARQLGMKKTRITKVKK